MAWGFLGYFSLVSVGLPVLAAAYIPVAAAALAITLHEIHLPFRRAWHAGGQDIADDAVYMVLIQIALPNLLSLGAVVLLANNGGLTVERIRLIWPHDLPPVVQFLIMLIVADFLRYWLHRASHRYYVLWRFHAVHHSPHKLY